MPDNFKCPKEEVHELRLRKSEEDINTIDSRTSANESDIIELKLQSALSEQKYKTLLDQLSGVPAAMMEMKEAMNNMQNEIKNSIIAVQNEGKNTQTQVGNLQNDISTIKNEQRDIRNENKEAISNLKTEHEKKYKELDEKISTIDNKGKVDFVDMVKQKLIPALLGGGGVWAIMEALKMINK